MLTKGALFSQQSLNAAAREADAGFHRRAGAFLRRELAPSVASLDDVALSNFVGQALDAGKIAGASSSRLLFQYLVPTTFWGRGFATDPQYQSAIRQANWPHVIPAPRQHLESALTALAMEIDRFEDAVATDRADVGRVLTALQEVTSYRWRAEDADLLPHAIAHVWPARARHLGMDLVRERCSTMLATMDIAGVSKAEAVMLICLSFVLGHKLHGDLHYPWIGSAFSMAEENRCPLLLAGLRTHYLAAIEVPAMNRKMD